MKLTHLFIVTSITALSYGATFTTSTSAPTVDDADIAMLVTTGSTDLGPDEGHLWSDRGVQGQTFTTGANATGYTLSATTIRTRTSSNTSGTFTVRVGTISGGIFTPILTEAENNAGLVTAGDFVTALLATPVNLLPNTVYGFDWGTSNHGFITDNNANTNYSGGQAYTSGDNNIPVNTSLDLRDGDRIFHLDIATNPIPEPSSALLVALGGLVCLRRQRTPVVA